MPCSSTPVVSRMLAALSHSGLLPSSYSRLSAFTLPSYPMTTTIMISGLNHTACTLAFPSFRLPLPGLPVRLATDLSAQLWPDGTFLQFPVPGQALQEEYVMLLFQSQRQSKPYKGIYISASPHDHPLANIIEFHRFYLIPTI